MNYPSRILFLMSSYFLFIRCSDLLIQLTFWLQQKLCNIGFCKINVSFSTRYVVFSMMNLVYLSIAWIRSSGIICLMMRSGELQHFVVQKCMRHFSSKKVAGETLQCGFHLPIMFRDTHIFYSDTHNFYRRCETCQQLSALAWRNNMPLILILTIGIFDC